jgi:hypothetical protein
MKRLATASLVVSLVLAAGCVPHPASSGSDVVVTGTKARLAGVGSRSLTDRLAATYFIRTADPKGEMVLDFVVFLKGAPGWTKTQGDWTFHTAEPVAFSKYKIAGVPFRVDLDLTTNEGKLAGRTFPTATTNVVVVDGFGGATQQVSYAEHQDLRSPWDADPLIDVLDRSPALQQALDLGPRASR